MNLSNLESPFWPQPMSRSRIQRRNINEPGHAHELTFSCYHRFPFLKSQRTCQWLIDAIDHARRQLEFDVWAWVFMPDHAHILIRPRQTRYDIAVIRRRIKEPVARQSLAYLEEHAPEWIPKVTRRRGQRTERLFWQSGGGYDRNVTDSATLLKMIDYIHLNPCRRGLVERAVDWMWSSAAWYLSGAEVPLSVDAIPFEWTVTRE